MAVVEYTLAGGTWLEGGNGPSPYFPPTSDAQDGPSPATLKAQLKAHVDALGETLPEDICQKVRESEGLMIK